MLKEKNLTILIAEDDDTASIYLGIVLEDYAKEFIYAKTGDQTVRICEERNDIDLILMDIKMPGINGYEATRKIREFNTKTIIIAQTAYAIIGDREKAIEAGCNDYISKPINDDELVDMIAKHFP